MTTADQFIILAGVVALAALRWGPRPSMAPPTEEDFDYWTTPYYLRANAPILGTAQAVMPQQSPYTFALGVPGGPAISRRIHLGE